MQDKVIEPKDEPISQIPVAGLSKNEIDTDIHNLFNSIRVQAELHYNKDYSYNGLCTEVKTVNSLDEALSLVSGAKYLPNTHGLLTYVATNGGSANTRTASCHVNGQNYVIAAPLSENSGFWCVDSQGTSKKIEVPPAAGALYCP